MTMSCKKGLKVNMNIYIPTMWFVLGKEISRRRIVGTELIADLTEDYVIYISSGRSPGHHDMEHTAGLLHKISTKELKQIVEEEGISIETNDTRPSVIVEIIKHLFADVIEGTEKLETREAKKPRTK